VSAKKVITAKTSTARAPQVEIRPVAITPIEKIRSELPPTDMPPTETNPAETTPAGTRRPQIQAPPSEEAIRVGAYFRWDAAGRPGGDGVGFWLEAEQQLLAGGASAAGKGLRKR
jgi:hypothetical protein